ncbi:MAG: hypothetical protein QOD39_3250, partial [Mycobacterium sp.]|nr:hypothetical protein [Mycobacterium sp.]
MMIANSTTAVLAAGLLAATGTASISPGQTGNTSAPRPAPYITSSPATPVALAAIATPNSLVAAALRLPVRGVGTLGTGETAAGKSGSNFFSHIVFPNSATT